MVQKKWQRMLDICGLLRAGAILTEEYLAQRYAVSDRTIRRDMLDVQGPPAQMPVVTAKVYALMDVLEECPKLDRN